MKNNRKHLQYERLRSWHSIWACPMIMSSLSTESTLNWGLVRVNEMATLPETFVLGHPGCLDPNVGGLVSPPYLI